MGHCGPRGHSINFEVTGTCITVVEFSIQNSKEVQKCKLENLSLVSHEKIRFSISIKIRISSTNICLEFLL